MILNKELKVLIIAGLFFLTGIIIVQSREYTNISQTLYVDDDGDEAFTEIWDAINHSNNGDTVYVYCGIYREHISIDKSIHLIGENKDCTIIEGEFKNLTIIRISASSVTVSGFTIRNSGRYAISMSSNGNSITDNYIIKTDGVHLTDADNNIISENLCNSSCVFLDTRSSHNIITKNNINEYLMIHSNSNIILENQIYSDTYHGMELQGSDNTIHGNLITTSLSACRGVYIRQGSSFNVLTNNTIKDCDYGLYVDEFTSENSIYHNNFIDNRIQQAYDKNTNPLNKWDNGVEGNYWSDYSQKYPNSEDLNNDGIWDDPYFISKDNKDNHPFVEELFWKDIKIPDLICLNDSITWSSITPGSIVTEFLSIKNHGDFGSELDWSISSETGWGDWYFTPNNGVDLRPEEGTIKITVTVVAPNISDSSFAGNIRIGNDNNPNDYCIIAVYLSTVKAKTLHSVSNDEVDQQQISDFLGAAKPFYNGYWLAQSFTPTKKFLTRVSLRLAHNGSHPEDALVFVYIRSALDSEDLTGCYVIGNTINNGSWIDFDFSDIKVSPGNTYYIVCRASAGDQYWRHYTWYFDINNPYPHGDAWGSRDYGETWYLLDFPLYDFPDLDFCFKTYGRDNTKPNRPLISGPTTGKSGLEYEFTASAFDPDGDDLHFLFDWGDGHTSNWIGPIPSGEQLKQHHIWYNSGSYIISVKVQDEYGTESEVATLPIEMPKYKSMNISIFNFLEKHPHLFPVLQHIFIMS